MSQPEVSLHLWTPVHSTSAYGLSPDSEVFRPRAYYNAPGNNQHPSQSSSAGHGGAGPSSSQGGVIAPTPQHPRKAADAAGTHDDDDSSPDSDGTVTASSSSKTRSAFPGMSTAQFFSNKADESLRFLTARQEVGKAMEEKELEDELRGKRVWRVGGLGMWSYGEEDKKAEIWREWNGRGKGREDWLEAARKRTEFYNRQYPSHSINSDQVLALLYGTDPSRNKRC